jgi:hypothetical protein
MPRSACSSAFSAANAYCTWPDAAAGELAGRATAEMSPVPLLDHQQWEEDAERGAEHIVRRREFELMIARHPAETPDELREAWEWADAMARADDS